MRICLRSRFQTAALFALVLFCASACLADSVQLTLKGASNYVSPDNAYVAPYMLQAAGSSQSFPVICDDYTVDVSIGDTWTAQTFSLSNLGAAGDSTRFFGSSSFANTSSATVAYEEAAWLSYQTGIFSGAPASSQNVADINYAIWYLFDPSGSHGLFSDPGYSGRTAQINGLLGNALTAVTTQPLPSYFSNVVIYTPSCNGQTPCTAATAPPNSQEYIGFTQVPEPGSLALLVTGFAGLQLRRRVSRFSRTK